MNICEYYSAKITPETQWIVVATLRYSEHLAFDRTRDVAEGVFEFFVPTACEPFFLELMQEFVRRGYVTNLLKEENRLAPTLANLQSVL